MLVAHHDGVRETRAPRARAAWRRPRRPCAAVRPTRARGAGRGRTPRARAARATCPLCGGLNVPPSIPVQVIASSNSSRDLDLEPFARLPSAALLELGIVGGRRPLDAKAAVGAEDAETAPRGGAAGRRGSRRSRPRRRRPPARAGTARTAPRFNASMPAPVAHETAYTAGPARPRLELRRLRQGSTC